MPATEGAELAKKQKPINSAAFGTEGDSGRLASEADLLCDFGQRSHDPASG
ncbi:MAG: hypothetical protein WDN29_07485 [Methylovirgula sp.]